MRRRWIMALGVLGLCLAVSGDSEAGLFRHRARRCQPVACTAAVTYGVQTVQTYGVQAQVYGVQPSPPGFVSNDAGAFLQALNAWRAVNGRPPAWWDGGLAAYAATNTGVHDPGSSGGGSQAWASSPNLMTALSQWQGSPAHAAILLNSTVVGASLCPSGATANCR